MTKANRKLQAEFEEAARQEELTLRESLAAKDRELADMRALLFNAENHLCGLKTVLGCQGASTVDAINVVIAKDEAIEAMEIERDEWKARAEHLREVIETAARECWNNGRTNGVARLLDQEAESFDAAISAQEPPK